MLAIVLAQAVPPTGDAWPWVAGVMAVALGWMAREGLKRLDHELEEWRGQAKTCTNDFGKTSDALRLANDTIESGTAAQTREIARNYERLMAIDAKLDRVLRSGQEL